VPGESVREKGGHHTWLKGGFAHKDSRGKEDQIGKLSPTERGGLSKGGRHLGGEDVRFSYGSQGGERLGGTICIKSGPRCREQGKGGRLG